MALTLEAGPWSFSVNNAWASGTTTTIQSKNALMAYKTALTAIGWSVVASSSSAAVKNVGDSSPDLWASTANINFAASGAHSWIILKDTVMNFYIAIDCIGSTGPNPYAYIYYNNDIGTNGTTSALPSGTKHTLNASTSNYWTTSSTANYGGYVHAMKPSDGKGVRILNFTSTGSGVYGSSAIIIDKFADAPSGFTEDGYFFSNASSMNIATSATITSQSPTWAHMYGQGATLHNVGAGRVLTTTSYLATEVYWNASTGTRLCAVTGQPTWYGGYVAQPIGFFNTTYGHFGRIRDLWLGSDGNATYSTYPSDGTFQFVKFGILVVPWSGVAPLGG